MIEMLKVIVVVLSIFCILLFLAIFLIYKGIKEERKELESLILGLIRIINLYVLTDNKDKKIFSRDVLKSREHFSMISRRMDPACSEKIAEALDSLCEKCNLSKI